MTWLRGETVTVRRKVEVGKDRLGEPVVKPVEEEVGNVLVSQSTGDELEATRPSGISIDAVLAFPKGYEGDLRGCEIVVRGRVMRVMGEPWRVPLSPLPWDMKVQVSAHDG